MAKSLGDWFGELARPFTFYTLAVSSSVSIVTMAFGIYQGLVRGNVDGYQAAAFAAAVLAGASAIYIGKSFENKWTANANATVEVERAKASPPPEKALAPAPPTSDAEDPTMFGGPRR